MMTPAKKRMPRCHVYVIYYKTEGFFFVCRSLRGAFDCMLRRTGCVADADGTPLEQLSDAQVEDLWEEVMEESDDAWQLEFVELLE